MSLLVSSGSGPATSLLTEFDDEITDTLDFVCTHQRSKTSSFHANRLKEQLFPLSAGWCEYRRSLDIAMEKNINIKIPRKCFHKEQNAVSSDVQQIVKNLF